MTDKTKYSRHAALDRAYQRGVRDAWKARGNWYRPIQEKAR